MKIEQGRRAIETIRGAEDTRNVEAVNNTDEEDELHPENSEKPVVPDSGDFLGNISCSDDEDYLGEKKKNLFKHRVTINKMQKMLQPHLSGNTVTAGWGK